MEAAFTDFDATLRDGRGVRVRAMSGSDDAEILQAFDHLSADARYMRFMRVVREVDQDRLRKTVLIVTHDMREAWALADRIGVLDAGRLIACDSPPALGKSTDPRVRDLLAGAGVAVAGQS